MQLDLTNPLLWVLGSLALAAIVTNLAWLASPARRRGDSLAPGSTWGGLEPLAWLAWALFLFLTPVAAWWAGALSPYLMGLSELDWVGTLASGGLLAAAIIGITIFGWLMYRHNLPARARAGGQLHPWLAPVDAALLQWHWAFYRAGVIGWLTLVTHANTAGQVTILAPLMKQPLYWGSWLGMLLVVVEWAINPFARRTLVAARNNAAYASAAERTVIRMGLAVATTALFILTRNFWLLLLCHVIVETAVFAFLPVHPAPVVEEWRPTTNDGR
jgi:hypothetical protein